MAVYDMPACCTVKVIAGFGNSHTADVFTATLKDLSFTDLREYLRRQVVHQRKLGRAALIATTNNEQKIANKALRSVGFKSTRYISKRQHSDTRVKVWIKYLDEAGEDI